MAPSTSPAPVPPRAAGRIRSSSGAPAASRDRRRVPVRPSRSPTSRARSSRPRGSRTDGGRRRAAGRPAAASSSPRRAQSPREIHRHRPGGQGTTGKVLDLLAARCQLTGGPGGTTPCSCPGCRTGLARRFPTLRHGQGAPRGAAGGRLPALRGAALSGEIGVMDCGEDAAGELAMGEAEGG